MGPVKSGKKNKIVLVIAVCGFLLLVWQALTGGSSREPQRQPEENGLISRLLQLGRDQSIRELLPVLTRQDSWREEQGDVILQRDVLEEWMPGYLYQTQNGQVAVRQTGEAEPSEGEETVLSLEELMQIENQEQFHEDNDNIRMLELESLMPESGWDAEGPSESPSQENEGLTSWNNNVADGSFVPHTRQQTVDLTTLQDYETLRNQFYVVDSITNIGTELLDVEKLTQRDMTIDKEGEGPQILIYHTHSQEGFADSTPGDDSTTIMGVGQHLADILEEQYGYQVLHHLGTYDREGRDNAYSRSLPEITRLLEENPQIQVVIDLHRDAVADETHLVMDLDGRPTARFMFFNGISWTRRTGSISYLQNDNLPDNLAFSFQMKLKAEEYYPGLTRKNYIHGYRYNMHLRPRTLLIELGAQNNTLEEAMNACDPIAHLLDLVLSGE